MPFDNLPVEESLSTERLQAALHVLERAARLLKRERNWLQGHRYEQRWFSRAHCLVGALAAGSRGYRRHKYEYGPMEQDFDDAITILKRMLNTRYLESWNDHPARRHAEVVCALDRAEMAGRLMLSSADEPHRD